MGYDSNYLKSLGKILMMMFITTAILLFVLAFFVQKLSWQNGTISIGISSVYVLSCFLGGFLIGKVQRSKKFVWGILISLMYVIAMLVITMLVKGGFTAVMSEFIINLLLCVGSGMLGGMLS